MTRPKHPNKEIEHAIRHAESYGWRYKKVGGSAHAWGRLLCSSQARTGCILSIWSTPRDAYRHARQILNRVMSCGH